MVVDDEEGLRETYTEVFATFNDMEVIATAEDGEEAIEKISLMEVKPDVIMMDVYMPNMDGITATESIVQLSPSTKVVMLTALSNQETVLKAFNAGATGYIVKGARMEYLAEVVRDAYGGGSPIAPEISKMLLNEFFPSKTRLEKKEEVALPDGKTKRLNLDNGLFADILSEMSLAQFTGKLCISRGEL